MNPDTKKTAAWIAEASEQFGLAPGRLVGGKVRGKAGSPATIEVLPIR